MPTTYIIGILLLLSLGGCAIAPPEPVSSTLQGGTVVVERLPAAGEAEQPLKIDTPGGSVIIERLPPLPEIVPEVPVAAVPAFVQETTVAPASPSASLPEIVPAVPPAPVAATPAPTELSPAPVTSAKAVPTEKAVTTEKPVVKPPLKTAVPAAIKPPKQKTTAPVRTAASTLDLDALEQRLKNTDAIGVFTKIALKNQVDDLLKRFKAYHESDGKTALSQLRQSYDQLLLKVNDVLKNDDPSLAGEIMGSREAIWSVLSDPVKFAKL